MRNKIKKSLAITAAALGLAVGGQAALTPATAQAWSFGGSCSWRTDGNWYWSPTYGRYYQYQGHTIIGGHYYRLFATYYWNGAPQGYVVIYCG